MSKTNTNIPNVFGLSDEDIKAIRAHETRMRDEAAKLYGYRSEESYVAMYHDEVVYGLRSVESIRMFLLKNESKKDSTLTSEKVNNIVEAVKAVTRHRLSADASSFISYSESIEGYYMRLTDNVSAWRVKKLCLADQLEHGLILNECMNADCVDGEHDDWMDQLRDMDELIDDALNLTLPFSNKIRRGRLSRRATHNIGQVVMYAIGVGGAVMLCAAAWPLVEIVYRFLCRHINVASLPSWQSVVFGPVIFVLGLYLLIRLSIGMVCLIAYLTRKLLDRLKK